MKTWLLWLAATLPSFAYSACPADLLDALGAKDLMVEHLDQQLPYDLNDADVEIPEHHMLTDSCDAWYTANYKRVTGSLHDFHCIHSGRIVLFGYFSNQFSYAIQNQNSTCPSGTSTYYRIDGEWQNRDPDTRYIERLIFNYNARSRRRTVQVLASCGSRYCDWGRAVVTREGGAYKAIFEETRKRVLTFELTRSGKLSLLAQESSAGSRVPQIRQAVFDKAVLAE